MLTIKSITEADRAWLSDALIRHFHDVRVAAMGKLRDCSVMEGALAWHGGQPVGFVCWEQVGDGLEVVGLASDRPGLGAGRALMDAALDAARAAGLARLFLSTNNDNIRAIRFYQQWGMHLAELHVGAAAIARALKPAMPEIGEYGIPVRDELIFERVI